MMDIKKISKNIFFLYLAIAPIYWLPGINIFVFNTFIKIPLLFLTFIMLFLSNKVNSKIRNSLLIVILSFLPYFVFNISSNGNFIDNFSLLLNYIISFQIILYGYNFMSVKNSPPFFLLYIVFGYLFLVFLDLIWGIPISPPNDSPLERLFEGGFTAKRTAWSNSIAMLIPIIIYIIYKSKISSFNKNILMLISTLLIIVLQLGSGGRAGFLASLIFIIFLNIKTIKGLFYLTTISFLGYYTLLSYEKEVYAILRIRDSIDATSATRLEQYSFVSQYIFKNPLTGFGFRGSAKLLKPIFGYELEFHNVWIRQCLDYGIVHGGTLIFIFSNFIISVLKKTIYLFSSFENKVLLAGVFMGIFLTFFEPNFIFGNIQNGLIWYFYLGCILFKIKK